MRKILGKLLPFPFIRQVGMMDCGPTCLAMILKHYGYHNITRSIVQLCETNLDGTSLQEISSGGRIVRLLRQRLMS
ncbi:MAG: hypothetical protein IPL65_22195 [Lewinellaceae bacterium]|nr:hypothetical protein [Lewinellaceae bacterium]